MSGSGLTAEALTHLTLAERAPLLRAWTREDKMRDHSYQTETALGPHVKQYLEYVRWRGLEEVTIENRMVPLRMLCIHYAEKDVSEFSGRPGWRLIEEFLMEKWGDSADATKSNRQSGVSDFFKWCYSRGLVEHNPVDFKERRRSKKSRREAVPREYLVRLVTAQPRRNYRLALQMLGRMAFRREDLRLCRLGDFDFANGVVYLFGKGSKEATQKMWEDLARDLEGYVMERAALYPDDYRREFLLFPLKPVRYGRWPNYRIEYREYRLKPLTAAGVDKWFAGCRERAGVPHMVMHQLRHAAATEYHYRVAKGDYELTRQFLRHEDIATTSRYITAPPNHLAESMAVGDGWAADLERFGGARS